MGQRNLPDWIEGFMRYTENSEPPLLFKEWTAVSVVASCLQRKCVLPWGPSLTFYPNMYIVLVAPAGKCRKGTAMKPGYKFLSELGIPVAAESITREALIRELKNVNTTTGDPTTGKVQFHSSLTIFSPELTVFLGYNNMQLMADLTDWYDCSDRWIYRTKNSGEDEINGVWVNLFGATTPELIQTTLPRDAIGGGLTSRMIFVYENRKHKIVPAPFLTPFEEQLREKLRLDLERINMLSGEFRVTEEFLDIWIKWYTAQEDKPPFKSSAQHFGGYFERRPTHVMKLSLILCASRTDDKIITGVDIKRAINLLERTELKMPQVFSGVGRASTTEVLNRIMNLLGIRKRVTYSELLRTFYHDADKELMDRIIDTLVGMKYCRRLTNGDEAVIEYLAPANPEQAAQQMEKKEGEQNGR